MIGSKAIFYLEDGGFTVSNVIICDSDGDYFFFTEDDYAKFDADKWYDFFNAYRFKKIANCKISRALYGIEDGFKGDLYVAKWKL